MSIKKSFARVINSCQAEQYSSTGATAQNSNQTINDSSANSDEKNKEESVVKAHIYNVIILDKSGSMTSIREQAVEGFNSTLKSIQEAQIEHVETQEHFITLLSFCGCEMKLIYDKAPVASVEKLKYADYEPCCSTPLFDAIGFTVSGMRNHVKKDDTAVVVVTIITDGYENASHEYNGAAIKLLIDELKNEGWSFTYMGANQDSVKVALSISIEQARDFDFSKEGTKESWETESRYRTNFYSKMNKLFRENPSESVCCSLKQNAMEEAKKAFVEEEKLREYNRKRKK